MPKKKGTKTSVKTYLAFVPAAILLAFIVYLVVTPPASNITTVTNTGHTTANIGGRAPAFSLNLIDGEGLKGQKLDFNPASGKTVFMDFIHEWCVHCNNMAPIIERLYANYRDKNVVFITVAGGYNTDAQKTSSYLKNHRVSWTAVFDPQLDVFSKYGVRGTPTYFIIGPDGTILLKLEGEQPYERLAQELDKYIAAK
ncbi:MAG: TlpA disulfide reductase family protein [Candidatus Caldarchaeum sp.]